MNKTLKYGIFLLVLSIGIHGFLIFAGSNHQDNQAPPRTLEERRDMRKNLEMKEINTDAKGKRQWMDRLSVWNEEGYKIEDIEYAVYGQKERVTYEYDASWKCIRENVYNDKNKLVRIRKFEYHPNGRKKIQYNYNPDGKLFSTKIFEYNFKD